ncbi:hypothetical protein BOX15_Mlig014556g2 [Macrostomum lignano]|uniref:Dendritic cell-specific transmembrane protein-like domain-containing protein n=1 Tax=Macrostomum lignano TaxID=282301 RepID=A0A267ESH3_9PLAT|nr:hypothetical protein BOX15_Mlig014556g2 [Macrostomum lignano]
MIPSMARGALRNALLIGCLVLLASGPATNLRSNMDSISASKSCLHEQFFDIVSVVKSLHGKNVVSLFLIPVRLLISAMQLVAEIFYRIVHSIYISLDKLGKALGRLLKKVGKMLGKLRPRVSFYGSCARLTRVLAKKYRRHRVLGGLVQMVSSLVNLVRSITGTTPIAKPTIGYFIHDIGTSKICPLLAKARAIIEAKFKVVTEWWQKNVLVRLNDIKAIRELIKDAIGPDTRVVVSMTGGFSHQLAEMRHQMQMAVGQKAKEVKRTYRHASRIVKIVCSVLSLAVFSITLLLSISFYKKYMRFDEFENNFVTAPFLRLEELEPPLLPLDAYEKTRVSILAESMISDVVHRLGGSDLLLTIIRLVPFILVMGLEWIFYSMAYFMEQKWNRAIKIERNIDTRLTLKAAKDLAETSPMALLLTIIIHMQKALREINLDINVLACSPKATKPNWALDALIGGLMLLYTLLTLFGSFFLKLRHHIMLELEPARAVQRAVWLRRQLQADRELLPSNRDLLKMSQFEQDDSSLSFLFNTYVKEGLNSWMDLLRSLFNLPTVRCVRCGIRGNLSMPNFNEFFTVCDSCQNSICAPCAHYTDRKGLVKLRESCPHCGLKMDDVEVDAEEIEDEDPLDDMLFNFLDLRPGYKVARSALAEHLKDIRNYEAQKAKEPERSFLSTLGADATINPNAKPRQ